MPLLGAAGVATALLSVAACSCGTGTASTGTTRSASISSTCSRTLDGGADGRTLCFPNGSQPPITTQPAPAPATLCARRLEMQFDGFSGYADVVTRGSNAAAGCHAADMLVGVISRPITGRPFTDTFQCHSSLGGVSVDVYADRS